MIATTHRFATKGAFLRLVLVWALLLATGSAMAKDYSGKYTDEQVTLELAAAGNGYAGSLTVGGKTYPVKAREEADKLLGTFAVGNASFEFAAGLDGRVMELTSGNKQYTLLVVGAPNPPPAHTQPHAQPGQTIDPVPPSPEQKPPAKVESDQAVIGKLKGLAKGPANPQREWTVIVYANADNDLEPFGVQDLNEMEMGLTGENVEIIVLLDRHEEFDTSEGDWKGARLYRVRPDRDLRKINSELLLDLGEINCGDGKVLAALLEGALKAYPARQHALIMWNHGGGWASMSDDHAAPGNSHGHDDLKLTELRQALEAALPAAGLTKLQIIGFDMCLMGQIEIATELAHLAEVMVASQALEPGLGWPYDVVVPAFTKGTAGSRRIGADIVQAFDNFYKTVVKEDVTTLSAMDLSAVAEFNAKLDALTTKYASTMEKNWPTVARSIFYGEQYSPRTDFRSGRSALATFDILDIFRRLRLATAEFPAEAEYRDFMAAADRLIIVSANSDRRRLSNGVAVYAPLRPDMVRDDYKDLKFAGSTSWPKFLSALHANVEADPSQPKIENVQLLDDKGAPTDTATPLGGNMFQFKLSGNNVIFTHGYAGRRDERLGGLVLEHKALVIDPNWILRANESVAHGIDMLMPKYKDGENEIRDTFDGMSVMLSNATETATCTFDATDLESTETWTTICLLEGRQFGDKPVRGVLVFDNSFFAVRSVIALMPQPDGSLKPRLVKPDEDTIVHPLHEVVMDNGDVKLHCFKPLTWGKGLSLVLVTLPPGSYEMLFRAETMNGKAGMGGAKFKVEPDPTFTKLSEPWKQFREEYLPGTWEVQTMNPQGQYQSMWKLKLSPVDGGFYLADITDVQTGKQHKMLTILDRRGLPHIRMIELLEGNKTGSTIFGPALFGISENNRPQLFIQMTNLSGINTRWERVEPIQGGPGPGPADEERFVPVETPEPRPLQQQGG